jgi:hypothetical protein
MPWHGALSSIILGHGEDDDSSNGGGGLGWGSNGIQGMQLPSPSLAPRIRKNRLSAGGSPETQQILSYLQLQFNNTNQNHQQVVGLLQQVLDLLQQNTQHQHLQHHQQLQQQQQQQHQLLQQHHQQQQQVHPQLVGKHGRDVPNDLDELHTKRSRMDELGDVTNN